MSTQKGHLRPRNGPLLRALRTYRKELTTQFREEYDGLRRPFVLDAIADEEKAIIGLITKTQETP